MLRKGDLLFTKPRLKSRVQNMRRKILVELPQREAYGHVAIYVGAGQVVEAQMGRGVVKVPVDNFFKKNKVRVFRVKSGDTQRAADISNDLIGKGYDLRNAIKAWARPRKIGEKVKDEVKILPKTMDRMFCSTVIVAAYPDVAMSSTKHPFDLLPVDIMRSPVTREVTKSAVPKRYREVDKRRKKAVKG